MVLNVVAYNCRPYQHGKILTNRDIPGGLEQLSNMIKLSPLKA